MKRLAPLVIVGFVIELLALAVSSGILAVVGALLIGAGVVWFVMSGTGTRLDRELRDR